MTEPAIAVVPDTPVIEMSGIGKRLTGADGQPLVILDDLSVRIEPGEIVAIVGRSGSGKSTLLNLIGLLDTPTRGVMRCDDRPVQTMPDAERSRLRGAFFGFVFQQFQLLERRSALDNVAEPLLIAGRRSARDRSARARDLLVRVGLGARLHTMPHQLSGGEQQRVAIARALVRSPRVILADEPTGALDETTSDQVLDILVDLARTDGTALIVVTHDRQVAERAGRILTLKGGRLEEDGS